MKSLCGCGRRKDSIKLSVKLTKQSHCKLRSTHRKKESNREEKDRERRTSTTRVVKKKKHGQIPILRKNLVK